VARDGEESNRVFGMARGDIGPHARQDEERRRVLGFPVDSYGPAEALRLPSLRHPIKAYKRWALRRRLGPYAPDDDDTKPAG